jgi:tetratricopeptide (TPR) repeat protein
MLDCHVGCGWHRHLSEFVDSLAKPDQTELKIQLALYYQADGRLRKAIEIYNQVLDKQSDNILALRNRSDAYLTLGEHTAAIADFEEALKLAADDPALLNNLAWVLATSPDAEIRDGKRAVELATKACELTDYNQAHILSTLAAAFAESGDFGTAIEWSKKAVDLDDSEQLEQLTKELASYRGGEPWRERKSDGKPDDLSKEETAASSKDE